MRTNFKSLMLLCFVLSLNACNDSDDKSVCGNGIIEANEACDGTEFGSISCSTMGFVAGTVSCTQACQIDFSGCRNPVCGDGILDSNEKCDTTNLNGNTCQTLGYASGTLSCTALCDFDTSHCQAPVTSECGNLVMENGEECDGEDFGNKTCAELDPTKPYGRLGCTKECRISTTFCGNSDLGLLAPMPDFENTDAQCSNQLNDFHTQNKDGTESNYYDCNNNNCNQSILVQTCHGTENSDETCSDNIDNSTGHGLHSLFRDRTNGLIDCEDPSCYKNWRVTVCADKAPKWELGADCSDGIDNDGDGLKDCEDPDCLHAGASNCELNQKKRILFDNAHHEMAGGVDWIIDITGRHPYPSKPANENEWHGSLSMFALDLLNTGDYIPETLPQDRKLTWNDAQNVQDLNQYDILVLPEPSSKISDEEARAIYEFVNHGGGLMMISDHEGADRDGNGYDSVRAFNEMLAAMPGATSKENNPFGFYVLPGSLGNSTSFVSENADMRAVKGRAGELKSTGVYGAAGFQVVDEHNVKPLLTNQASSEVFAITASVGNGRVVAIGDSAITGDGTNYLALTLTTENGYIDTKLDNRILLLNSVDWLANIK